MSTQPTLILRIPSFLKNLYPNQTHMNAKDPSYTNPDALFLAAVVPERAILHAPAGAPYDKDRAHEYWSAAVHILNDPELEVNNHKRVEAREVLVEITNAVNAWIEECRRREEERLRGEEDGGSGDADDEEDTGDDPNLSPDNDSGDDTALQRAVHQDPKADPLVATANAVEQMQIGTEKPDQKVPGAWPTTPTDLHLARRGHDRSPMTIGTLLEKPLQPSPSESWNDMSGAPVPEQRPEPPTVSSHGDSRRNATGEAPGMNLDGRYAGLYITPPRPRPRLRERYLFGAESLPDALPPKSTEPVELSNWFGGVGLKVVNPDAEPETKTMEDQAAGDAKSRRPDTPTPWKGGKELRSYHEQGGAW